MVAVHDRRRLVDTITWGDLNADFASVLWHPPLGSLRLVAPPQRFEKGVIRVPVRRPLGFCFRKNDDWLPG